MICLLTFHGATGGELAYLAQTCFLVVVKSNAIFYTYVVEVD